MPLLKRKKPINLYFDMDGVLAKYELEAYQKPKDNPKKKPAFIDTQKHYYLHVEPDPYMVKLTQTLVTKLRLQTKLKVNVIATTRLHPRHQLAIYQANDKKTWLKKYYPHIDTFTPCLSFNQLDTDTSDTKANTIVKYYNHDLTPHDILIDDFNEELTHWQTLGGTSVKYLNNINNQNSWKYTYIDQNVAPIKNIDWLFLLIEQIHKLSDN